MRGTKLFDKFLFLNILFASLHNVDCAFQLSPLLYPVDYELSRRRMDECRSTGNKVVSIAAACLLSGLSGSSYAGMHIPKQTVHLSVAYNECEYWCGEVGESIDKVSGAKSLPLP